jgi:hypothetical protein
MFLRFPWMTKFILFNRSYVQLGTKILRHLKQMFPSKFHIKEILQNLQKNQHIDDWSIIGRATKVVKFICSYDFHYVVNKAWVIVHILFVVVISSRTLHHLLFCFTVGTGKREEVCKYVSLYISALFVCILTVFLSIWGWFDWKPKKWVQNKRSREDWTHIIDWENDDKIQLEKDRSLHFRLSYTFITY